MKYIVSGRSSEAANNTEKEIENVLSLLCKTGYIDEMTEIHIIIEPHGSCLLTEVMMNSSVGLIRNKTVHDDFLTGLELSVKKIIDILRRQKARISKCYDGVCSETEAESVFAVDEITEESIQMQKMNTDEAILALELQSLPFYAYLDSVTGKVTIVYKKSGRYYKNVAQ